MKRIVRVALMCALVVLLTAGIAAAATINCGGGNCSGTNGKDTINESSVNDNIFGGGALTESSPTRSAAKQIQ